jgi:hypothetical protein
MLAIVLLNSNIKLLSKIYTDVFDNKYSLFLDGLLNIFIICSGNIIDVKIFKLVLDSFIIVIYSTK